MKVLLLKPSSLGDVVQALPVLRAIKRHLPASEVYWWIDGYLAPLLADDPDLAGVIPFERRAWARPANWLALWRQVRWMRQQRFDWVIDLQCLMRSGVIAWLANGDLLVGLDEPREGARGFYDQIAVGASRNVHAVARYQAVLPLLGLSPAPDSQWLPQRPAVAAAIRQKWPVAAGPWMLLQPGARWPTKRWPVEHFAQLVRLAAARRPDLRFAILGGPDDRPLGRAIARAEPQRCLDLTGALSLPEMVEWIRLSAVMVTNDTGPMHAAAAVQTPIVALFGPTDPRVSGPYGQVEHALQSSLPCVPCQQPRCRYHQPLECLRSLSPETVLAAVERRMEARAVGASAVGPATFSGLLPRGGGAN